MTIRINKTQLKHDLLSPRILLGGFVTSLLYLSFSTLIFNHVFVFETLGGYYPVSEKITLLVNLLSGVRLMYTSFELFVILVMGFLMGVNVMLLADSLSLLAKRSRKDKSTGDFSLGLGFMGMLATTGCASCGITVLSFLGPTVSVGLIPFQSLLIQGVSLMLLIISLIHILNKRHQNCIVAKR